MLNYPMFNYMCVSTYQFMSYNIKYSNFSLAIVCVSIVSYGVIITLAFLIRSKCLYTFRAANSLQ